MHPLSRTFYDRDAETNLAIDQVVGHLHEPFRLRDLTLALEPIMTLPQPTAFLAPLKGSDGECPCCRRTRVTLRRSARRWQSEGAHLGRARRC